MTTSPLQLMTYRTCLNVREYKGSNNPIIETAQFQSEHLTNILQTLSGPSGRIFLKIIKRVAFQSGRIGMPNPVGMESSFQSGWNGMKSFHSVWNGMAIPFRPEWRAHSIPAGMEWSHSIPTGME